MLSSMFDNDASDPGYLTTLWYLSKNRSTHDNNEVPAEKILCRRCLRGNSKRHKVNGPDASCKECTRPGAQAYCDPDLRGAELYHGVKK